jgi:hypothetical protein
MRWVLIVSVAIMLLGSMAITAKPQERPATAPIPAQSLSREQFIALPSDAVIEINGQRISKGEFLERNQKAVEEAAKKAAELRVRAENEFKAYRKSRLDQNKAALEEANKKVQAEVDRLVAADAAAHGSDWEARKKQAIELLNKASQASSAERAELAKQAIELLRPPAK